MKQFLLFAICLLTMSSCQESLEKRIQRESREYTEKNCPQTFRNALDDGSQVIIWLDSIAFDTDSKTLSHYFRIDRPEVIVPELQRAALISQIKNDTKFQVHRDHGYNFHFLYRYSEKTDSLVYEVTVKKGEYWIRS